MGKQRGKQRGKQSENKGKTKGFFVIKEYYFYKKKSLPAIIAPAAIFFLYTPNYHYRGADEGYKTTIQHNTELLLILEAAGGRNPG